MSVKLKITVDPPENAPFGYRKQSFFVKIPNRVWSIMNQVALEQGTDVQEVFTKWMTDSLTNKNKGLKEPTSGEVAQG